MISQKDNALLRFLFGEKPDIALLTFVFYASGYSTGKECIGNG